MMATSSKSLKELIGELCDDRATARDLAQLNALLKSDLIAQDEYLDHMFLNGLLHQEFAAKSTLRSYIPENVRLFFCHRSFGRVRALVLVGLMFIGVACGWWMRTANAPYEVALVNSSFENTTTLTAHANMLGWYGDVAYIVEKSAGITPPDGKHMLQLVRSATEPNETCEVYQIVELQQLFQIFDGAAINVEASVVFNSLPGDNPGAYVFGITMFATQSDPLEQSTLWPTRWEPTLASTGSQVRADFDLGSWQQLKANMRIPVSMQYLVIQISVRDETASSTSQFPGQFVDDVKLHFTSG